MGNWTPEGFIGTVFRTIGKYLPPPADVPPPPKWGDEATVRERFANATEVKASKKLYSSWVYPFGVSEVIDFWCQNYGPLVRGMARLDANDQQALRSDLVKVFERYNRGSKDRTLLEGEFLSVDVTP